MFTDLFIKRPVLSVVVSLLIFLFGLQAISKLAVREFPELENTVITITTVYPGAHSDLIQGFLTTPIQKAIASSEGIDYITSSSTQSQSVIKAFIKLGTDPNVAFTDVMSKVASVQDELPKESRDPVITKETGSQTAYMYISFSSKRMNSEQITDYLSRVVQPKLETIDGVSHAQIFGDKPFSMRIWLNPEKMASVNLTPNEIISALRKNNFQSAAGKIKGKYIEINIDAQTDINTTENFKNLILKEENDELVYLRDVATVELGAKYYDSSVFFNGKKAVFLGIYTTPTANPLTVIQKIRKILPDVKANYPPDLNSKVVYDATEYIQESIKEVFKTIIEATLIVIIVIFLFLGSIRSVLVPVVTIPLSLVGVCTLMWTLGYSINLLTLLAMVLAIGLVVDDAIVVLENIHRHVEEGLSRFKAAIIGAREIALPVISMTITLAAVYSPIGFMGGLTGSLFKEFAFTLASSVIISGVVALTLSPMMCSKLMPSIQKEGRLALFIDQTFDRLKNIYQKKLHYVLSIRPAVFIFASTVLLSCVFLYIYTPKELAPEEDKSVLFSFASGPKYANIDYMEKFTGSFNKAFKAFPELQDYFVINGIGSVNDAFAGWIMKPWEQRKVSQADLKPKLQGMLDQVPGLQTVVFPLPSLPSSSTGLPIEFVINSITDYPLIYKSAEQIRQKAQSSGLFLFVKNTLSFDRPELAIKIDRAKAGMMGISMEEIGAALATDFADNYVNRFSILGRSYEVIPQVGRKFRLNPRQIENVYIKTKSKELVPLSTVVSIKEVTQPNDLTQFQQLNSATIEGVMMPGTTIGQALNYLKETAEKTLPKEMAYDYAGDSRQFIQEESVLIFTFFFALLVIFLVLAAQFESFRDPLIILISVPMSICGALIPLNLGLATINIYTQVGLITLIGLITKHGILMVEFANKLREKEGLSIQEAIEKSASIRLRPVLMTTAATVLGVTPLLLASGAGAKSRFSIGLVIASGMLIGTLFTLFVVPTVYTWLSKPDRKLPITS
jgi:multidrug efflux pump